MPNNSEELQSSKVDRRVKDIILTADIDKIANPLPKNGYKIAISKLLVKYNEGLEESERITENQLKHVFDRKTRIDKRENNKVDNLINKILFKVFHPIKIDFDKSNLITEAYFPECFTYKGTDRIPNGEKFNSKNNLRIHLKCQDIRRAKQVQELQKTPRRKYEITRKYKVGNEEREARFIILLDGINMNFGLDGDIEAFFFQEAIKRGYIGKMVCPGTKKMCPSSMARAKEEFISKFRRSGGFYEVQTYDPTPYLNQT